MPSPRTLHDKFKKAGLDDFAQHSRLPKRVGGQECSSEGLELAIATAVRNFQYQAYMQNSQIDGLQNLEAIVKTIFFGEVK